MPFVLFFCGVEVQRSEGRRTRFEREGGRRGAKPKRSQRQSPPPHLGSLGVAGVGGGGRLELRQLGLVQRDRLGQLRGLVVVVVFVCLRALCVRARGERAKGSKTTRRSRGRQASRPPRAPRGVFDGRQQGPRGALRGCWRCAVGVKAPICSSQLWLQRPQQGAANSCDLFVPPALRRRGGALVQTASAAHHPTSPVPLSPGPRSSSPRQPL